MSEAYLNPENAHRLFLSDEQQRLEGIYSDIKRVYFNVERLDSATTLSEIGTAMIALQNSVSDLVSWHPLYDVYGTFLETGEEDE